MRESLRVATSRFCGGGAQKPADAVTVIRGRADGRLFPDRDWEVLFLKGNVVYNVGWNVEEVCRNAAMKQNGGEVRLEARVSRPRGKLLMCLSRGWSGQC